MCWIKCQECNNSSSDGVSGVHINSTKVLFGLPEHISTAVLHVCGLVQEFLFFVV